MRLQTLVAMAPHTLVLEAVDFHKQLAVVEMKMAAVVEGSHMELEVEVMAMVGVANCNELVVEVNYNELEVVVVVNGKLVVVEVAKHKLLVLVVVMAMAGAYNELAVEVKAMEEGANILHMVAVEGEVVLYKGVGMEVAVNGLAEVAGEIGMDK